LNLLQGALTGGLEDWLQGVLAQVQYRTHAGGYLEKSLVHDSEGRNRVSKRTIERDGGQLRNLNRVSKIKVGLPACIGNKESYRVIVHILYVSSCLAQAWENSDQSV
jgi:hypothetical protein